MQCCLRETLPVVKASLYRYFAFLSIWAICILSFAPLWCSAVSERQPHPELEAARSAGAGDSTEGGRVYVAADAVQIDTIESVERFGTHLKWAFSSRV